MAEPDNCLHTGLFEKLLSSIKERKDTAVQMKHCNIQSLKYISEDRPLDTTLDCSKLRGLVGNPPRSMVEVIKEAVASFYSK